MLQRDYLMRMTEILVKVLSKVLLFKKEMRYEDAKKEIETAAKTIVGIDLRLLSLLSVEDILKLLKTSDVYAGRCIISAELLREYGDVFELQDYKGIDIFLKALHLYLEALFTKELPIPDIYFPKVNEIIDKLTEIEVTIELKYKLIEYYELSGQYSKAEDILFELLGENSNKIKDKAILFYKRLQNRTNEQLNNGNLSREEVEESLEEIYKLKEE